MGCREPPPATVDGPGHGGLNMLRTSFRRMCLAGTILASATAPAAFAQDEGEGLETIVVTANRTEQSVQKAPVAVTAYSSDALERLQVRSIKDLSQIAPNVRIVTVSGGSAGITPYVRGGSVTDGANITSEPEVGIYIDDIYQPRAAASFLEALDIERVEVLRGPQGTLYGRNSSAGALKFVTRAPGNDVRGKIELGTGSWDEFYGRIAFSGPVSSDGSLRAGFSGMISDRGGGRQFNATLNRKVGAQEFQGFQGDLYYQGGAVTVRLKGFYSHYQSDGVYPVALDPTDPGTDYQAIQPTSGSYRTVLSPSESFTRDRQYGTGLTIKAKLSDDITLSSITGWSYLKDDWGMDFSGGIANSVLGIPGDGYVALFDRQSYSSGNSFSQELQLQGKVLDDLLSFVGGLYYFRETGTQAINTALFFAPASTRFDIKTDSYAAFGQISLRPTEALTITAGGRYTEDDKSLDAIIGGTPVVRGDKFRDFLPKFGIDYQIGPDLLAYASYSEGFKAGGYNGLANTAQALNSPFDPQKVKAYEIGLKSEFLDRRARFNVSAFINDYSSIQQQLVTNTGAFLTQNYVARHKGVEVEASVRPVEQLTLWANGVYNDGVYKRSASADPGTSPYVGNQMTNVFKYQVTIGADLTLDVGPGEFLLGGNFNARSDYFATPDNVFNGHVPATEIIDAYIGYKVADWTLRLAAKNLTDERSWTTGFGFGPIRPRFMADPRMWKLSLSKSF